MTILVTLPSTSSVSINPAFAMHRRQLTLRTFMISTLVCHISFATSGNVREPDRQYDAIDWYRPVLSVNDAEIQFPLPLLAYPTWSWELSCMMCEGGSAVSSKLIFRGIASDRWTDEPPPIGSAAGSSFLADGGQRLYISRARLCSSEFGRSATSPTWTTYDAGMSWRTRSARRCRNEGVIAWRYEL
jgi:hypothetical protein